MQQRPSLQQLASYANLISAQDGASEDSTSTINLNDPSRINEYLTQLDYHGITMLALHANTLPDSIAEQLAGRRALMIANEALKQNALVELFNAFANAGLKRCVLFKGSALAYTVYQQPWLRPRSDNDCLIDKADYPQFAKVLNELGYQKHFAIEGEHISYQHSFSKALAGQSTMNIDLHWRINNRQTLANTFNVDELIENGNCLVKLSNAINVPSSIDSVLIASLHRVGHHQREERLTWLYDIYLLAKTLDDHDWQQLCHRVNCKKLAGITLDALQYCERLFYFKLNEEVKATLTTLAKNNEPSQLFLQRDLSEWRYFISDIKALDGWQNKLELIRENFLPKPDYVREQMGTNNIVLAYLKRIARGLKRVIN